MKRAVQWLMVFAVLAGGAFLLVGLQPNPTAIAQVPQVTPGCESGAPVKTFYIVTAEVEFEAPEGVTIRDRGHPVDEIEGYTFDPATIIANDGDCVRLFIHTVKGAHHNVFIMPPDGSAELLSSDRTTPHTDDAGNPLGTLEARPNPNFPTIDDHPEELEEGEFARGEQALLEFTVNGTGVLHYVCEIHTWIEPGAAVPFRGYDDQGNPVHGPMIGTIFVLP